MKTTILLSSLLALSACGLPQTVAIPASFIAAPTVDRAANAITGGKVGYTISGEAGERRNNGDKFAAFQCAVYGLALGWYDPFYFSPSSTKVLEARQADHCEKWRLLDSGELAKEVAKLPPRVVPKPPVDAKNGLRIVR